MQSNNRGRRLERGALRQGRIQGWGAQISPHPNLAYHQWALLPPSWQNWITVLCTVLNHSNNVIRCISDYMSPFHKLTDWLSSRKCLTVRISIEDEFPDCQFAVKISRIILKCNYVLIILFIKGNGIIFRKPCSKIIFIIIWPSLLKERLSSFVLLFLFETFPLSR